MLRLVLLGLPLLSLRRDLRRRRALLLRMVLLGRPLLSLRLGLWRLRVLLLQDFLAGLERLGVLWDQVARARCLHLSGSRRW